MKYPEKRPSTWGVWVRGLSNPDPTMHRMTWGAPYDVDVTLCGIVIPDRHWNWVYALPRHLGPTVKRCKRCDL